MLSSAVDVMITQNERRSLALAKATVSIGMSGFSVTDYSRVKELIELGHKSAASQSADLLRYAIENPAEWKDTWRPARRADIGSRRKWHSRSHHRRFRRAARTP